MLNIQTKRGCPYQCIYCSYPLIDGSKVRTMEIDSLIETIARAKEEFGVRYLFFTDSVFNIKPAYNAQLAEALIKSKLNISWGAYFSPAPLSEEELALYKASGLTHIEFGSESFSDETLSAYGKRFTFDDILKSSSLALKLNIYYAHFLILGGWRETPEALRETIERSRLLSHTVLFPFVGMRIYPGTPLQSLAIASGDLSPNDNLMEPRYYLRPDFDLEKARQQAKSTGKAWVFPDEPLSELMMLLKLKRKKKGPLWEYLRKP